MTRNYSTTILAFVVLTMILLTFPSQVRSEDTQESIVVAQVGSGVIGAVKNNPEEYAEDEFSEDMWGILSSTKMHMLPTRGRVTTVRCSSSTITCTSTS